MTTAKSTPSILIIGAGIFGTSTAYHLSRTHPSPEKITLIDRTPSPPRPAASTDINKIVRADYSSPFYMDLAYEALDAWMNWDVLADEHGRFFHRTGWVNLEKNGSDVGEKIRQNFSDRGKNPTKDFGLDDALRERWNGVLKKTEFDGLKGGYYNPEAGWVDSGTAVSKMATEAMKRGVKYICGDAQSLILDENGVTGVKTILGDLYEADEVLLCTGAWTSQFLSHTEDQLGIEKEDRVENQVTATGVCVAHFKLTDAEMEELTDMPVIIYGELGEAIPPPKRKSPYPDGYHLLKFTNAKSFKNTTTSPSGNRISVPPEKDQTVVPEDLKMETMEQMIRKVMPQYANRPVEYWRLCWDAITPSQDQLITRHPHPRLSNLYLAVGGSFHSWKFLPIIGKYVVNMLNKESNGEEKDTHWAWKTGKVQWRGAQEKLISKRELKDLGEDGK